MLVIAFDSKRGVQWLDVSLIKAADSGTPKHLGRAKMASDGHFGLCDLLLVKRCLSIHLGWRGCSKTSFLLVNDYVLLAFFILLKMIF